MAELPRRSNLGKLLGRFGTAELAQIDQRVCPHLHAIMPLLYPFKAEQQPLELIFPVNNRHLIPNDGERYRNGEPIATGCVESTVNEVVRRRFCKKQQMQWSKEGAHWLWQTRVRTLNGELSAIFKRWYPGMDLEAEEMPAAA